MKKGVVLCGGKRERDGRESEQGIAWGVLRWILYGIGSLTVKHVGGWKMKSKSRKQRMLGHLQ